MNASLGILSGSKHRTNKHLLPRSIIMACTDAANDRNNALLVNSEDANAKVLCLSFGAYMN